jgi:hypothetical protein
MVRQESRLHFVPTVKTEARNLGKGKDFSPDFIGIEQCEES